MFQGIPLGAKVVDFEIAAQGGKQAAPVHGVGIFGLQIPAIAGVGNQRPAIAPAHGQFIDDRKSADAGQGDVLIAVFRRFVDHDPTDAAGPICGRRLGSVEHIFIRIRRLDHADQPVASHGVADHG